MTYDLRLTTSGHYYDLGYFLPPIRDRFVRVGRMLILFCARAMAIGTQAQINWLH